MVASTAMTPVDTMSARSTGPRSDLSPTASEVLVGVLGEAVTVMAKSSRATTIPSVVHMTTPEPSANRSAELPGPLRQAEPDPVDDAAAIEAATAVGAVGRSQRHEQRREVLGARVRDPSGRRLVEEVDKGVDVVVLHRLT